MAPATPRLVVRVYSPWALVLPADPSPASIVPGGAMGEKATVALASGLPLSVTFPVTGAIFCLSPHPDTNARAAQSSQQRTFIVPPSGFKPRPALRSR